MRSGRNANRLNPFGLTARQCEVMDAMCRHYNHADAARELGLSEGTTTRSVHEASRRMGARNSLQALLMWDRATREKKAPPPAAKVESQWAGGKRPPASVFELGAIR